MWIKLRNKSKRLILIHCLLILKVFFFFSPPCQRCHNITDHLSIVQNFAGESWTLVFMRTPLDTNHLPECPYRPSTHPLVPGPRGRTMCVVTRTSRGTWQRAVDHGLKIPQMQIWLMGRANMRTPSGSAVARRGFTMSETTFVFYWLKNMHTDAGTKRFHWRSRSLHGFKAAADLCIFFQNTDYYAKH